MAVFLPDHDQRPAVGQRAQDRRVAEIHVGAELVGAGLGLVVFRNQRTVLAGAVADVGIVRHHLRHQRRLPVSRSNAITASDLGAAGSVYALPVET